ncbi:MAG: peptidylprolyl isomerase [Caulobacteraceae bacterium]
MAAAQGAGGVDASQVTPGLGGGAATVVNGEVITNFDVQQRAMLIAMMAGIRPNDQNSAQLLQQAMRSLIDEHLEIQELRRMEKAQKFQIVAEDDEVEASIDGLARDNNISPEEFRARLTSSGLSLNTLRDQIRAQMSWNRMIQGRYGSRVRVSSRQVDQEMQRLTAAASQPQYQVSEIYIDAARAGGMNEALEGARQLAAQIQQQSAPFPAVARQFSAASTSANGGDMGWVSAADLAPEVAQAIEQMPPRSLSAPIQTADGVYLIYLRDKRVGTTSTLISLKQAAIAAPADAAPEAVDEATRKLQTLIASKPTCDDIVAKAAADPAIVANDLGEGDYNGLPPEFQSAVASLEVGQISQPVRTTVGVHALLVCGKRVANPNVPSRDVVERRMSGDQLTMLARRSLRDLRATATIEQP